MFKGSIVAIVTPFNEDLSINYSKLEELLEWHVSEGTDGIVILGTTGEAATMSTDEKLRVIEFTVKVINNRIPVIAGTGSNDTVQSVAFSQKVEKLGVDGLLIVTPYYNKANTTGFIRHFKTIANQVTKPIIMYNVPSRTGCILPIRALQELVKVDNIVGIKEASGDMSYTAKVAAVIPDDFGLFSGSDDQVVPVLSLGGHGVISVAANVIPGDFSRMVKLYLSGKIKEATKIQLDNLDLINSLFIETNPIPVKEVLNQMGKEIGGYRLPLCEMEEDTKSVIVDIVRRYQL